MIQLTRLRQNTPFILNPDLIERVDTHVDTVVRLTSGTEYVVNETGEEIVRRTAEFRARVIALAGILQATAPADDAPATASSYRSPIAALTPADGSGVAPAANPDTADDSRSAPAIANGADGAVVAPEEVAS